MLDQQPRPSTTSSLRQLFANSQPLSDHRAQAKKSDHGWYQCVSCVREQCQVGARFPLARRSQAHGTS